MAFGVIDSQRFDLYSDSVSLTYPVILKKSEEGFAVGCPALPGCWSQGVTEAEALQNIRDAISEYLFALRELTREEDTREVEVVL